MTARSILALLVPVLSVPIAVAETSPPQAYTLIAEAGAPGEQMTYTIHRDGPKARVEMSVAGHGMTTFYDMAAHKVYWIGMAGPGTCSSGSYVSARLPVGQDPLTGAKETLAQMADGRKVVEDAGPAAVNGVLARQMHFVGKPKTPPRRDEPVVTKVWVAEQGRYVLKAEGTGKNGKPVTLFLVKQLKLAKPAPALLVPPAKCEVTNAEMDDTGMMRAHGEASVSAEATASADLGADTQKADVKVTQAAGAAPQTELATINGIGIGAKEVPFSGPCGRKLQVTGEMDVDGPATIAYRIVANVGGIEFPNGSSGTVTVGAAGTATFARDITMKASRKGQLHLEASVQGPNGHNSRLSKTAPIEFDVTCTAPPAKGKR